MNVSVRVSVQSMNDLFCWDQAAGLMVHFPLVWRAPPGPQLP